MARTFEAEFHGRTDDATGVRRGFFAAVDAPPNPAAYTGLRTSTPCGTGDAARRRRRDDLAAAASQRADRRADRRTRRPGDRAADRLARPRRRPGDPGRNEFFGGNTGVTGLMTGEDVSRALAAEPQGHRYLLPDVCLSDEGRFLDGLTVDDLPGSWRSSKPTASRCVPLWSQHDRHRHTTRQPRRDRRAATPNGDARHRRHHRASQRRQEHAVQPHRRQPAGDRRGPPGHHPRPQGTRGRVARRAVPRGRHRRLDAGRRRSTRR